MSKLLVTIALSFFLILTPLVSAQVTEKAAEELKEIQNLKEKLASKVAELRSKNDRAYAGEVIGLGKDSLKIRASDNKDYQIKVDSELTKILKIQGTSKKEIDFKNLKKGDYLIATGPIDAATVNANYIYVDEQFITSSGKVSEVKASQGFIRVIGIDKETYTLDIENTTKRLLLNIKSLALETTTLAKIKSGDTLHFFVKKTGSETEKNRYPALKILVIPQEYFIKPQ